MIGAQDKLIDFTVALDKLDKIGKEGVVKECSPKELLRKQLRKYNHCLIFSGTNLENLTALESMLAARRKD